MSGVVRIVMVGLGSSDNAFGAPHLSVGPLCPPQSLSEGVWGQQSRMTCPILQWGNSSFCSGLSVWMCALFLCFYCMPRGMAKDDRKLSVFSWFCLAWKCSVWPSSIAGIIAIRLSPQFFSELTSQIYHPVHLDFLSQTLKIRFREPWQKDNRSSLHYLLCWLVESLDGRFFSMKHTLHDHTKSICFKIVQLAELNRARF